MNRPGTAKALTSEMSITAITWMPFYPVWSLICIFVGVFVIYGLAAHKGLTRLSPCSTSL